MLKEAAALNTSNIWMWVTIGLGNLLAVATATIFMWYCCRKWRTTINSSSHQDERNHQDEPNQGVTLEMNSTTTVTQEPTTSIQPTASPRVWNVYKKS